MGGENDAHSRPVRHTDRQTDTQRHTHSHTHSDTVLQLLGGSAVERRSLTGELSLV